MEELTPDELQRLPSTFYRVAVKVLIMDELGRLLVVQNDEGEWEIPGGGWERDESLEECVDREMAEEIGAKVTNVTDAEYVLPSRSKHGWRTLRVVVRATLASDELQPGDDIVAYRFVNRHELLQLKFDINDEVIQQAPDRIWSE